MTIREVGMLLAVMAVYDQRSIGESDVIGWQAVVPEWIEFQDCRTAVVDHYRISIDRIMPAQLIRRAKAARSRRLGLGNYDGD